MIVGLSQCFFVQLSNPKREALCEKNGTQEEDAMGDAVNDGLPLR